MKSIQRKTLRRDAAIERLTKTIAAHQSNMDLTKRIVEDHVKSGSKKFMKFNPNMTDIEIHKLRDKKLERAKTTLENTKANLR
jgi:hypothetical protein